MPHRPSPPRRRFLWRALAWVLALTAGLLGRGAPKAGDLFEVARPFLRLYGVERGLPGKTIYELAWDARGRLWAGTQAGAAWFDGVAWVPVQPPGQRGPVRALLHASDGTLWLGTEYDGPWRLQEGRWSHFLPGTGVNHLAESMRVRPGLYAGTRGQGLLRWDGQAWVREAGGGDWVWSVQEVQGPEGGWGLWATGQQGLWASLGGPWSRVGEEVPYLAYTNGLARGQDEQGRPVLWVGCWRRGLACWDGRAWRLLGTREGLPSLLPTGRMAFDPEAPGGPILWVGTYDRGLAYLQGGRWRRVDRVAGRPLSGVYSLVRGNSLKPSLWIACRDTGVASLDLRAWYPVEDPAGLMQGSVTSLEFGSRGLWVGKTDGLFLLHDGVATKEADPLAPQTIVNGIVAEPDGRGGERLLVGTAMGMHVKEGGRWQAIHDPGLGPGGAVYTFCRQGEGRHRRLWAGGETGLSLLEDGRWRAVQPDPKFKTLWVYTMCEELRSTGESILWAGTRNNGVYRLGKEGWSRLSQAGGQDLTWCNALCLSRSPDGRTWLWGVFVGQGLGRLELGRESEGWRLWGSSELPALPTLSLFNVVWDGEGALYLATARGVARLRLEEGPQGPLPARVEVFNEGDGLPSEAMPFHGFARDARGRLWAGTERGLAVLDPAREGVLEAPPTPQLDRIEMGGQGLGPVEDLRVDYRQKRFRVEFVLPLFHRREDARFRSQLVGYETQPGPWRTEANREFTGLPRGRYQLKVWAMDHAGRVSRPLVWDFRVLPAPWATWWAWSAYVLAALGLVLLVVRLRTRVLQAEARSLEALVAERTGDLARARDSAEAATRAKTVFLTSMSHEIRTPLNAVIGFSDLMRRDASLNAAQRDKLGVIHRSGEMLLRLINDILDLSKIEAGRMELRREGLDLRALVEELLRMLALRAQERGVGLELRWDPRVPAWGFGDEQKLRQVLLNLLGNAVKFTERGSVELFVEPGEAGWLRFRVRDTGPGMEPQEVAQLFQAFVQTSSGRRSGQGTGLGLAITHRFVELMGGELQVESRSGEGSEFRFSLPWGIQAPEEPAPRALRRPLGLVPGQDPGPLLVVDDDADSLELLLRLLRSLGFLVEGARDGAAALGLWRRGLHDVVLLDLALPGLGGAEVARAIRAEAGDQPPLLIAVTANVLGRAPEEAGFDACLPKPLEAGALVGLLEARRGLRFRWEGEAAPAAPKGGCPPDFQREFREALVLGDFGALEALNERLRGRAPDLAERVGPALRAFDIQAVESILFPS